MQDQLKKALDEQNKFILELFNDNRIPNEVKVEYAEKYNELKIKYDVEGE